MSEHHPTATKAGPIHPDPYPHAGTTVTVNLGQGPVDYRVEDWWDRVTGSSWMWANGNPAAIMYAARSAARRLPTDNEVLYGKVDGLGYIVHISEIVADDQLDAQVVAS